MEGAMGADFSGVRVHTGSEAAGLSQDLSAQAFTYGSDIYFNEGKYNPGSTDGQKLLAHELTHTVQQGGGEIRAMEEKTASKITSAQESPIQNMDVAEKLKDPNASGTLTSLDAADQSENRQHVDTNLSISSKNRQQLAPAAIFKADVKSAVPVRKQPVYKSTVVAPHRKSNKESPTKENSNLTGASDALSTRNTEDVQTTYLKTQIRNARNSTQEQTSTNDPYDPSQFNPSSNVKIAQIQRAIQQDTIAQKQVFDQKTDVYRNQLKTEGIRLAAEAKQRSTAKIQAVSTSIGQTRNQLLQHFQTAQANLAADAVQKRSQIEHDRLAAHSSLNLEIQTKKQTAREGARVAALQIQEGSKIESTRATRESKVAIDNILSIARQQAGRYGTTPEGRSAAREAIMQAAMEVVNKIRSNGQEIALGAEKTAQDAGIEMISNGNELAKGFGQNANQVHQNIDETSLNFENALTQSVHGVTEQLTSQKNQALSSLATLQQQTIANINQAGRHAETFFTETSIASSEQLDYLANTSWRHINRNVSDILTRLHGADGQSVDETALQTNQEVIAQSIQNGREQLEPIIAQNTTDLQEQLQRGTLHHVNQMEEVESKANNAKKALVTASNSGVSTLQTTSRQRLEEVRSNGQSAHQQTIIQFGNPLQQQIASAKQEWAKSATTTVSGIRDKVTEGLSKNAEIQATAANDFQAVGEKAAEHVESPILSGIWRGIVTFAKGLGIFLLLVAAVFVLLFVGAWLLGMTVAAGVLLKIALVIVGIGMLLYALYESIQRRTNQLVAVLMESHADPGFWGWVLLIASVTFIVIGDVIGVTPIIEGIIGQEAITGRRLSTEERAEHITVGILTLALILLGPWLAKRFLGPKTPPPVDDVPPRTNTEPPTRPIEPVEPRRIPIEGMSAKLLAIRETLTDPRAIAEFDRMYEEFRGDNARMEPVIERMSEGGNLEQRLLERAQRRNNNNNRTPYGEALAEFPDLKLRAERILGELETMERNNPQIRGLNRQKNNLRGILNAIEDVLNGRKEATNERAQGIRGQLTGAQGEMNALRGYQQVTEVNRKATLDGRPDAVDIDIVADNGRSWVEVKTENPYGLGSEHWTGSATKQGLRTQAAELLRAATQNPLRDGTTPKVIVDFQAGVSEAVAAELRRMGAEVRGREVQTPFSPPTIGPPAPSPDNDDQEGHHN
jgi:hypothetical protein